MKFSKHSSQVLQKCASQSNDLLASVSNSSNTREACPRQRTSIYPCFADAKPLYLKSSPSALAPLPMRVTWWDLCSQVLPSHLRHGSAQHSSQDDDQTPPSSTLHLSLASSKMTPLKGRQWRWGQSCQLKLQDFSPALRQVRDKREQSPTKLHSRKGFAFCIQYISLRQNWH